MKPVRFCMLTTFYPPYNFGGDGIGIERLCHGLVRRGHEVTVVHDVDAFRVLNDGREPAPAEHPDGLTVVGLRTRFPMLSELLTHQTGRPVVQRRRLQGLLSRGQFDVINYHNISLIGGPGILAMGDAVKLYMAHEHWLVCPTHVLWRHDRERCTGKQCFRCTLSYRRPPQLWRWTGLLERQLRHVDTFIAMSEASRDKHREFGFQREMEVLPYFLPDPADAAAPAAQQRPHERPYFLFVGRLEKIKGLDDVIPAFARYADADLLIAGEGTHGAALRALAAGNDRVRFLGHRDQEEVKRLYDHALALVVPSECYETFGIILIEAFRQRVPVIARRVGPLPEIVGKAQAGLLFDGPDELLAALRELQADDARRQELAENGYRAFLEHWTESAVVPRYLELARDAAARRGDAELAERLSCAES